MAQKLHIILSFFTIAVLAICNISPSLFWPAGILTFVVVPLLLFHIILSLFWLIIKPIQTWSSILVLIVGWSYFSSTVAWHKIKEINLPDSGISIKVISYNVRVFNAYAHLQDKHLESSKAMIKMLQESKADVICLQEFYNDDKSRIFNTTQRLTKKFPYNYLTHELINSYRAEFGIAIFSKYPILNYKNLKFSKKTKNQACYIDIIKKGQKVRIYNIHLQSMSIKEENLISTEWREKGRDKIWNEIKKVKKGMQDRALQVHIVLENVIKSPYPVILCADLNDTPYTYTYRSLKSELSNAFEMGGKGFGFTYRGRLPFLRIDHQFSSNEIKVLSFKTLKEYNYTDHYPIIGHYWLER